MPDIFLYAEAVGSGEILMGDQREWGQSNHVAGGSNAVKPGLVQWRQAFRGAWPVLRWVFLWAAVLAFFLFGLLSPRIDIQSIEAWPFRLFNVITLGVAHTSIADRVYRSDMRYISFLAVSVLLTVWI